MSKKLISLLALATLLLTPLQAFADKGGKPNEQAYKNASDNAAFKRDDKDKDNKKHKDKHKNKDTRKKRIRRKRTKTRRVTDQAHSRINHRNQKRRPSGRRFFWATRSP
jgi:hypothetical protein